MKLLSLACLLLIVVAIRVVIDVGWKFMLSGIISGFETILDVGHPS